MCIQVNSLEHTYEEPPEVDKDTCSSVTFNIQPARSAKYKGPAMVFAILHLALEITADHLVICQLRLRDLMSCDLML